MRSERLVTFQTQAKFSEESIIENTSTTKFMENPDLTSFYSLLSNSDGKNRSCALQLDDRGRLFFTQTRGKFETAIRSFAAGFCSLIGFTDVGPNWGLPDKVREERAMRRFSDLIIVAKNSQGLWEKGVKNWRPDLDGQLNSVKLSNMEKEMLENFSISPAKFYNDQLVAGHFINLNRFPRGEIRAISCFNKLGLNIEKLDSPEKRKEFSDVYNKLLCDILHSNNTHAIASEVYLKMANYKDLFNNMLKIPGFTTKILNYYEQMQLHLENMCEAVKNGKSSDYAVSEMKLCCLHNQLAHETNNLGKSSSDDILMTDMFNIAARNAFSKIQAGDTCNLDELATFFNGLMDSTTNKVANSSRELLNKFDISNFNDNGRGNVPENLNDDACSLVKLSNRKPLFLLPNSAIRYTVNEDSYHPVEYDKEIDEPNILAVFEAVQNHFATAQL